MKIDICGMEKLSLVDYDQKIACTLFVSGCNFRCPFCHNGPLCVDNNEPLDFDEVIKYLESRKNILDAVVITGGEPTLYPMLKERILQIKALGYLVKLDTNGTHPEIIRDLIDNKLVDYIAMDIKNSPEKYKETTKNYFVDLNKIKESIAILKEGKIDYEFRTTLVKEFHTAADMSDLAELIKGDTILYLQKFVERDGCLEKGLNEISKEEAEEFKTILEKKIKHVYLRGY